MFADVVNHLIADILMLMGGLLSRFKSKKKQVRAKAVRKARMARFALINHIMKTHKDNVNTAAVAANPALNSSQVGGGKEAANHDPDRQEMAWQSNIQKQKKEAQDQERTVKGRKQKSHMSRRRGRGRSPGRLK